MIFYEILLNWYDQNKRDLPWRNIDNPYVIWLAEIIFQQTRIEQGTPYFLKFLKKYPSIFDLAADSEENILKMWQGLGYYSRGRNLHFTAQYVVNECGGNFPTSYAELLKLKGVGPYIAAEVASVCFNEVVAAVDGNVQRLLARYFHITEPVNSPTGDKIVRAFANTHISPTRPGDFNQAMMDMGALVCTPAKPSCDVCVLRETCKSFSLGVVNELPNKIKKAKVRNRYFNYYVVASPEGLWMKKRGAGDIWQGLYEFPLIESTNEKHESKNESDLELFYEKRLLSHQRIHMKFYGASDLPVVFNKEEFELIDWQKIPDLPVFKSVENLFASAHFNEYTKPYN